MVVDVADGESSPRFLGPLKMFVDEGLTGESASSKVDVMSTRGSSDTTDASSMSAHER